MTEESVRSDIVSNLHKTKRWSKSTAEVGKEANFCCEYCHLDLLSSPEHYKLWQVDHIVPLSKGGEATDPKNLALDCKTCNWDWKGRWNPAEGFEGLDRKTLIERVRTYVKDKRAKTEKELEDCEIIFGQKTRPV